MKPKLTILFFLLLAWSMQIMAAPVIGMDHPDRIPDQYIVVLKADAERGDADRHKGWLRFLRRLWGHDAPPALPDVDVADEIAIRYQATIQRKYLESLDGFVAHVPPERLADMADDRRIEYIEADRNVHIEATQAPAPWGLDRIDQRDLPLDNNYTYNTTAANVNAYIIDSGIRLSHVEFAGRAQQVFTTIQDPLGSTDCNGHGTHVAGTVGGATFGVAKQVSLYSVRVLDCEGSGFLSNVIAGVDWVMSNHVEPAVANMSLGGTASRALDTAVRNAVAAGVTFVVAAGNDNANACNYSPARVDTAITVGASTPEDSRAFFSNWGTCLDIFAPGTEIVSAGHTSDTAVVIQSGTSMATPHVTGVAALYLAENPGATPSEVSAAIINTATTGELSNIGVGSPNRLVYSLLTAPDPGTPPLTCPAGYEVYTGTLAFAGDSDFHPNGTFYFANAGTHNGRLLGPAGANFDLYLWRWNGFFWQTVRSSTSPDAVESISYNAAPGFYVWRIVSASGSGDYRFCLSRP